MNSKLLTSIILMIDWFSAIFAWGLFYYFRKTFIEQEEFNVNESFYLGLILIPIAWLFIYLLQGTYQDVRRLHRLKIINISFVGSVIGSFFIFFVFLLDDTINGYQQYYTSLLLLFTIHFTLTVVPRFIFVSFIVGRIHRREVGFKTLVIGGSEQAIGIVNEINDLPKGTGHDFVGFININGVDKLLEDKLEYLGHIDDVEHILREYKIEEVIIALESTEHDKIKKIISRLDGGDLRIKVLPDMYDILSGSVEMSNIFGSLLIDVNPKGLTMCS